MHIWVVGEEKIMRKTIEGFLSDLGHSVVSFNIDEIFNQLEDNSHGADVVILKDLLMSNDRFFPKVAKMHQLSLEAPIIILDAHSLRRAAELPSSCGVHGVIKNPIQLSQLEQMLTQLSEIKNKESFNNHTL